MSNITDPTGPLDKYKSSIYNFEQTACGYHLLKAASTPFSQKSIIFF